MKKELIKPYGDTLNDGIVQLAFTLPVENTEKAGKAAEIYVSKLNMKNITVVHSSKIGDGFTFFVVYARARPVIDYAAVKAEELKIRIMDFDEINVQLKQNLKRRLRVVGATIGNDAHTVGIDAILNMKGYNHDYGLERYPQIETFNMGAQVSPDMLVKKALETDADAILVSRTVTQKDTHIRNLAELIKLLEAARLKDRYILVAGGPGITNDFAVGLGYDAGFGRGARPSQVASFLVAKILEKKGLQ